MDRVHGNLIIILLGGILLALGGILFVLLVGREEAISAIGGASVAGAFAVALVVGTLALLFIGYVLRKRRQGQPWLFHFILWPAYIGVLAVLGLAAHHAFDKACGRPQECVADSDDPGQGFQFEGGHHSNRRRAVLARRHVHGVTALVRRQDRIGWLRSFACCLLSM